MENEKWEKETQANGTATPGTMTQVMSCKTGQQSYVLCKVAQALARGVGGGKQEE